MVCQLHYLKVYEQPIECKVIIYTEGGICYRGEFGASY
jgi:hypothetical protein